MNRFAGLALLGPYLRPYRGKVALAVLSLFVAAGTVLAFGACLRALIDRGFAQGRPDVLNYALASLLAVAFVLAIASGARFYLVSWLGERVVGTLRRDLFAHVVRLGPAWFEIKRSGDVMSRISSDAQLIEQVIGSSASVALRNTLMCIGGIAMLVITNPKLALWVLAAVPVVVAPIIIFGRKVRRLSREAQARVADMVSEGAETLDAVRTVQAFAQEESAGVRFTRATEKAFEAAVARISRRAIMTTFVIFIVFSAVGFLLWMGGQDVISGRISAGDLSAWLGDLPELLASYDLDSMVCVRRKEYDLACNWKEYVENAMEAYHVHTVHKLTLQRQKGDEPDVVPANGEYMALYKQHEGSRALLTGDTGFPPIENLAGKAARGSYYPLINPSTMFGCTIETGATGRRTVVRRRHAP